ncbi:MAG: hypothetical protein A3F73_11230 [Gallionellales bacterium RIFCSPLOWO2_12_FULL_59_22]|nr:MAG: hypothetical protein A2Z65_05140 [Gallionellales bacterium RIFCSPLOWO2_02_58_13]OGT11851.1 MAG: hypothetical protein A3F73_11230 [Gallionellales bacterium RIFCSPLOWO2_12_FULL_59_22]
MILRDHQQGETHLGNNPSFFFAAFVLFVVQLSSVRLKIKQNYLVIGWRINVSGAVRLQGA